MRRLYRILNVFTHAGGRLTGNPLCVFEDGSALTSAQMQALARQFNLSETTFVLPSDKADALVRIFTPTYEMPFAGHPTLGTAHVVREMKALAAAVSLELRAGVIPVRQDGNLWELRANRAKTRALSVARGVLAAALGLREEDLGEGPLWVDCGTEQLIVPLLSEDAVRRLRPSCQGLLAVAAHEERQQVYVFTRSGEATLLSRFFFNNADAMLEDPATGSATANLGGWFLTTNPTLPLTRTISQGEMAGRPSTLRLRIDKEGDVFVAGEVIEIGRGQIDF